MDRTSECRGAHDYMDVGGSSPKVGALGDAGAVAEDVRERLHLHPWLVAPTRWTGRPSAVEHRDVRERPSLRSATYLHPCRQKKPCFMAGLLSRAGITRIDLFRDNVGRTRALLYTPRGTAGIATKYLLPGNTVCHIRPRSHVFYAKVMHVNHPLPALTFLPAVNGIVFRDE
jgi:hypothetical protein